MTTICFIANFNKTYFFHAIAQKLKQQSVNICWITVSSKLYKYLKKNYDTDSVLLVNRTYVDINSDPVGDFRINELVYGDRALCHFKDEGIKLLTNIQRPIYDFIKAQNIRWVVGEVTWAHELLVHRMTKNCEELDCTFLNPHTIRIPNGRFAFFLDEFQSIIYESKREANDVSDLFQQPTDAAPLQVEKPYYLALNDQLLKKANLLSARVSKVKRFITEENIDPLDPTLIPERWIRFKLRIAEEFNKEMYRFVRRAPLVEAQKSPYVFIALHKQPEASIDVIGRYHENQLQNICDVWRVLPQGWNLVVKEHTNAIGDRSLFGFYNQISSMPGVIIVDEKEDSHELIKKSQLVITVSGTVAYEAALMGIPSATLGPVFFNKLPYCINISNQNFKSIDLVKISLLKGDQRDVYRFRCWLIDCSFEGIISDPVSNYDCLLESNITNVTKAIAVVIEA